MLTIEIERYSNRVAENNTIGVAMVIQYICIASFM
jgi:hypothetical protein